MTNQSIRRAMERDRLWRDTCQRGKKCVYTETSRREPITMGGKVYPGVFCDVCGIGREDV